MSEDTHRDVVIEGTVWHPIEAGELARHIHRYVGEDPDLMHVAKSLSERIGHHIEIGHGEPIVLTDEERKVTYTVVNEWRQYWDIPEVVNTLYDRLHAT